MQAVSVKTILNKKAKRDPWFLDEFTLNPYSGCSFNCLFCYIRGSKYGEHAEMKTSYKQNAPELLDKALSLAAKRKRYGFIVLASSTDPYLHAEDELKLTRKLLEIILKFKFPLHIITRSPLVLRDIDLIKQISDSAILPADLKQLNLPGSFVTLSMSTIDESIAKIFEPGSPPPPERLNALRVLRKENIFSGISAMPFLPFITDKTEALESFFKAAKEANAAYLMPASLGLYGQEQSDSRTLVIRAVKKHFPELAEKYERWFAKRDEMPDYYRDAFGKKMKELSLTYGIPDRIINCFTHETS